MTPVIDVHTHMYSRQWLALIREHGGPDYEIRDSLDSPETIFYRGASFCVLEDLHLDYAARIDNMTRAGVDVAIVTLPAPSAFWGDRGVSFEAARIANDAFAAARARYPDLAVAELDRACRLGAVGVLTLGNINGRHLTDEVFEPVWQTIDDRALPVLLHPTSPPGTPELGLAEFAMVASVGFMVDTSVAVVRMIGDGFFDRFPNLKLIAAHAGATLPYLAGRLDRVFEMTRRARVKIERPPSEYLRHIYYDAVTYRPEALAMCIDVGGAGHVLYGSDYPFNIGDMEGCLERVDGLAADIRDQVRGANAARIFGI